MGGGDIADELAAELRALFLEPLLLLRETADGGGDLAASGAQEIGYLRDAPLARAVVVERVHAAYEAHAHAAAVAHGIEYLYDTHLACAGEVGRTAGAAVDTLYLHDTHVPRQLQLAAVLHGGESGAVGEEGPHRDVRAHGLVRAALDVRELLCRQLAAEVYRHALLAHVEAHVVVAVEAVDYTGDDMLTGVVLHAPQTLFTVHAAAHGGAGDEGRGGAVPDDAVTLMRVRDAHGAYIARVRALSAALGEEGRAVKGGEKTVSPRLAGRHHRLKFKKMAVEIIKLFGHYKTLTLSTSLIRRMPSATSSPMGEPRSMMV